jgi:Flp pilus assembly protein CpaB
VAVRSAAKGSSRRQRNRSSLGGSIVIAIAFIIGAHIIADKNKNVEVKAVEPTIVAEYDTVDVPVPVETVPSGTKVKDIVTKVVKYPRHQIPSGALLTLASVQDAVTTTMLPANLPLFRENLSIGVHAGNPVIEQIPLGMRAITMRVDATSAVEGWAGSGSIVDVLLVEKDRTSVIAEQVRILSAERVVTPLENVSTPQVPSTVTLLVTQQQALALTTAVPRGRIAFALRSKKDEENWQDKNFTPDKLHGRTLNTAVKVDVKGFVSVKTDSGEKKFALTDDGWIPSEVTPKGFMIPMEF